MAESSTSRFDTKFPKFPSRSGPVADMWKRCKVFTEASAEKVEYKESFMECNGASV